MPISRQAVEESKTLSHWLEDLAQDEDAIDPFPVPLFNARTLRAAVEIAEEQAAKQAEVLAELSSSAEEPDSGRVGIVNCGCVDLSLLTLAEANLFELFRAGKFLDMAGAQPLHC